MRELKDFKKIYEDVENLSLRIADDIGKGENYRYNISAFCKEIEDEYKTELESLELERESLFKRKENIYSWKSDIEKLHDTKIGGINYKFLTWKESGLLVKQFIPIILIIPKGQKGSWPPKEIFNFEDIDLAIKYITNFNEYYFLIELEGFQNMLSESLININNELSYLTLKFKTISYKIKNQLIEWTENEQMKKNVLQDEIELKQYELLAEIEEKKKEFEEIKKDKSKKLLIRKNVLNKERMNDKLVIMGENKSYYTIRGLSAQSGQWFSCTKPVFFDLGNDELFLLKDREKGLFKNTRLINS